MKSLINSVRLMGNVGTTPEVKSFDNGNKMAKMSLATNEKQKNAKGEIIEITHWHNLVFWGKQAEIVGQYFTKGVRIAIEGTLTNRTYETSKGEKRQIAEVRVSEFEFISNRKSGDLVPEKELVADDLPF